MEFKALFIFIMLISLSCSDNAGSSLRKINITNTGVFSYPEDNPYTHIKNIPLPAGFERSGPGTDPFAVFLRNTGLKKNTTVYLYNGQPKRNQSAQFALLNIPVGNKDLQQCADAVMRLRAEYLFDNKQFDKIIFFDNDHTAYKFSQPFSRDNLTNYLDRVFAMCGTASLSKQLKPVTEFYHIQPGDVLIRGGFPGHAVIVMDVAVNAAGEKIYLLAQGYMPAQDIHILKNPGNENLSPWYEVNDNYIIQTPEYNFRKSELKRW